MSALPVLVLVLVVVTAWRRRAARLRQQSGRADVIAPAALRHPDADRSRWIVGTVAFGGEAPVFEAQPDVATTRVVLDPDRFGLDGLRTTELSEALSILPGMRVLRLRSPTGLVEIALQPADAEALARRYRE